MINAVEEALEKRHGSARRKATKAIFDEVAAAWQAAGLMGPRLILE